ncbi:unnamed protein product [Leptidea sinapis]|uniref:Uncharacterized protein n=1 Tax=Leptidea sinapis TaxID=189913 RepID=A0A5E4R9M6_9NEOP|nr:unnamed protein product [Leptidea sinapis]
MNGKLVLILAVIVCSLWFTECCEPDQAQYGCKFSGTTCTCGNGCKTEEELKRMFSHALCERHLHTDSSRLRIYVQMRRNWVLWSKM